MGKTSGASTALSLSVPCRPELRKEYTRPIFPFTGLIRVPEAHWPWTPWEGPLRLNLKVADQKSIGHWIALWWFPPAPCVSTTSSQRFQYQLFIVTLAYQWRAYFRGGKMSLCLSVDFSLAKGSITAALCPRDYKVMSPPGSILPCLLLCEAIFTNSH